MEDKPVVSVRPQRSQAVQKKLDEANEALAELSEELLDLLFSRSKEKKQ